ncbi:hypothetical protein [Bacillus marasmi]|uniref:hypothetical protein n=1 Tax=Bacillus marasmi TaxID=1926279 RepID=UPI0011CB8A85|nr:hypothetical protein [Bacillus marasmi]
MSPLHGLLKKDFRISRILFLTWVGAVLLMMIIGVAISAYTVQPAGTYPVIVMITLGHFVFAPVMMFVILNIEAKNQLWLYTSQSGAHLLLSKLIVILSYQFVTQIFLTIFSGFSLYWYGKSVYNQLSLADFAQSIAVINFGLLIMGLYFACWLTFYWTLFQSLKQRISSKLIRSILVLLIMASYNIIESLILRIEGLKDFIFKYRLDVFSDGILRFEDDNWNVILGVTEVPVIPLVHFIILTILLFFISAKVLERKVEV